MGKVKMTSRKQVSQEGDWKVSVVIPAYNAEAYIARAIESVLGQSHRADEIIVVDDGSSDQTGEVVKKYGSKVRYIHQENLGVSVARNKGVSAAQYPWIAFLDGDDELLPQMLELQMSCLQRNPELRWTTGNFVECFCDEDIKREHQTGEKIASALEGNEYFLSFFKAFTQNMCGCVGTLVIQRQAFEQVGGFRIGQLRFNDLDLWLRFAYLWPQIGFVNQPLCIYHMEVPNSTTRRYDQTEIFLDLIDRHLELSAEHGQRRVFETCIPGMVRHWIYRCMFDERIKDVREIIIRYDRYLPSFYKSVRRLLTIYPETTLACMPVLRRINRFFRLGL